MSAYCNVLNVEVCVVVHHEEILWIRARISKLWVERYGCYYDNWSILKPSLGWTAGWKIRIRSLILVLSVHKLTDCEALGWIFTYSLNVTRLSQILRPLLMSHSSVLKPTFTRSGESMQITQKSTTKHALCEVFFFCRYFFLLVMYFCHSDSFLLLFVCQ